MDRRRWPIFMAVAVGFFFAFGSAKVSLAQDIEMPTESVAKEVPEGKGVYAIGLGAATAPEYEGSEDNQFYLLPYVSLRFANHMSVDLIANTLKANLIPSPTFRLGPIAQYIGERDNVDNNKVDKLDKVDASFMLGGFAELEVDHFMASIEAMKDVADGNDGSIVRLRVGYKIPFNKTWILSITAYTTWADDDYMSAYFEVDQKNSLKSGLKQYDADSGFKDFGITLPLLYNASPHWSIMGVVGYKRLIGDAADSPIVDDEGDENQFVGGAFAIYRF